MAVRSRRRRAARARLPGPAHRRLRPAERLAVLGAAAIGLARRRLGVVVPAKAWALAALLVGIAFCNPALWWAHTCPICGCCRPGCSRSRCCRRAWRAWAAAPRWCSARCWRIGPRAGRGGGDGGKRRRVARVGRQLDRLDRAGGPLTVRWDGFDGARTPARPRAVVRRGRPTAVRDARTAAGVARYACAPEPRGGPDDLSAAPARGQRRRPGHAGAGVARGFRELFAARRPAARARQVMHLFMAGGPSQLDLFTPKPALAAHDGQPLPPTWRAAALRVHQGHAAPACVAIRVRAARAVGRDGVVVDAAPRALPQGDVSERGHHDPDQRCAGAES